MHLIFRFVTFHYVHRTHFYGLHLMNKSQSISFHFISFHFSTLFRAIASHATENTVRINIVRYLIATHQIDVPILVLWDFHLVGRTVGWLIGRCCHAIFRDFIFIEQMAGCFPFSVQYHFISKF